MQSIKVNKLIRVLGVLGFIIWGGAIFVREVSNVPHTMMNFIAGIAPNFGAVWLFAFAAELIYSQRYQRVCSFKCTIGILVSIIVLGLGSEVIHEMFLNSPFDGNDMVATLLAALIFGICKMKCTSKC